MKGVRVARRMREKVKFKRTLCNEKLRHLQLFAFLSKVNQIMSSGDQNMNGKQTMGLIGNSK